MTEAIVWFGGFMVDKNVQIKGIGKRAFLSFMSKCMENERFEAMLMNVHPDNLYAFRFYQRLGFGLTEFSYDYQEPTWIMKAEKQTIKKVLERNFFETSVTQRGK